MPRIVYTVASGWEESEGALGLGRSLKLIGDETRRVVVTDQPDRPWHRSFDEVLPLPDQPTSFESLRAMDRTDADHVLYVDAASLAFRRLDPIFEYCRGMGFAAYGDGADPLTLEPRRRAPDRDLERRLNITRTRVDGRFLYYERGPQILELTKECLREKQEMAPPIPPMPGPGDPASCITEAMHRVNVGLILPPETQFFKEPDEPRGLVRLDVRTNMCQFLNGTPSALYEPYIYAARSGSVDRPYKRQLRILWNLELYANRHGFGYMPPLHKLRRSIEKRILRLRGKL